MLRDLFERILRFFGWKKRPDQIQQLSEKLDFVISHLPATGAQVPALRSGFANPEMPQSIMFSSDSNDSSLMFNLRKDLQLDSKWKQLDRSGSDNFSKDIVTDVIRGGVMSGAGYALSQNLFTSTVDPATLMKLAKGGLSSAVVGSNGKIISQAGFVKAGTSVFTPVFIFQALSIVTGQYYMAGISKQLNAIQAKLDELLILHHTEREARLRSAFNFIQKYSQRKVFEIEDLVHIRSIIGDLVEVREEYHILLENSVNEIKEVLKTDTWFSTKKEADIVSNKIQSSGFIYKMGMCLKADELFHMATIVEFHMNLFAEPTQNRIKLIESKLSVFQGFSENELMFKKTEALYNKTKNSFIKKLEENENKSVFSSDSQKRNINDFKQIFKNFEVDKRKSFASTKDAIELIVKPMNQPLEIAMRENGAISEFFIKEEE
ncbi:hypothetical protein SAMN04489723_12713 [Algoriphagus aquimarinus]|uniref:Uncharacterized protein n=2 Tax=Algoriphagus aquimarinus TaxID=237018 RepID=A0A1I1CCQ6_9BACT|nr:hypothetical protein SAMN04489723_12713 [Algoriphagus aquimarinus]